LKYKIVYLPIAVKDLQEAFDYIFLDKPLAAKVFLNDIDRNVLKLKDFSNIGIIPKDTYLKYKGYKILIVDNYLIFYLIKKDTIEIQRILHGKRKYQFII